MELPGTSCPQGASGPMGRQARANVNLTVLGGDSLKPPPEEVALGLSLHRCVEEGSHGWEGVSRGGNCEQDPALGNARPLEEHRPDHQLSVLQKNKHISIAACLLGRAREPTSEPCSRSVGQSLVQTTGLPLPGIVILSDIWTLYLHCFMDCSQQPKEGNIISSMSQVRKLRLSDMP